MNANQGPCQRTDVSLAARSGNLLATVLAALLVARAPQVVMAQAATEDPYAGERGDPKTPKCDLTLTFDGEKLTVSGLESKEFPAVSGRPHDGKFDNSPERQKLKREGPLPAGSYWIDPGQLHKNWWWENAPWGRYRITIHPYEKTETHGRGGFFIHGGTTPGSAGCIDLTDKMTDFAKLIEKYKDCHIKLTVAYRDGVKKNEEGSTQSDASSSTRGSTGDSTNGGGDASTPRPHRVHIDHPPGWGVE
jgi:hypothetical protein